MIDAFSKHTKTGIRLTDDYVEIDRKQGGLLSTHAKGTKRIPIRSISAVQLKKCTFLTAGFLQLTIPGGNESQGKTLDAVRDENSVLFRGDEQDEFIAFEAALQDAIMAAHRPQAAVATTSVSDELIKLASLRDAGVLTQDEFEAQKTRLLK